MDRTLFTPPMIETFRVCRRAYRLAYTQGGEAENARSSAICKKFILKALAEINRGRIVTVNQVQKFLGQHWPVEKIRQEDCVKAFLFAYKTLTNYVVKRYRPDGAEVAAVNLKVRARLTNDRVYLEDTFDLVLWHRGERRLEFVDYHLHPLKSFDQSWPSPSILVKHFLAERLRSRFPFEKLTLTFCRVSPQGFTTTSLQLDEAICRAHWPQVLETIEEMKQAEHEVSAVAQACLCKRCACLSRTQPRVVEEPRPVSRTA